jgi:4-hydroxybenzoate polyprenyltransferase
MVDKLLAVIWMLVLIVFMGIVLWFINELALWIIVGAVLLMAIYDFYLELWGSG